MQTPQVFKDFVQETAEANQPNIPSKTVEELKAYYTQEITKFGQQMCTFLNQQISSNGTVTITVPSNTPAVIYEGILWLFPLSESIKRNPISNGNKQPVTLNKVDTDVSEVVKSDDIVSWTYDGKLYVAKYSQFIKFCTQIRHENSYNVISQIQPNDELIIDGNNFKCTIVISSR